MESIAWRLGSEDNATEISAGKSVDGISANISVRRGKKISMRRFLVTFMRFKIIIRCVRMYSITPYTYTDLISVSLLVCRWTASQTR